MKRRQFFKVIGGAAAAVGVSAVAVALPAEKASIRCSKDVPDGLVDETLIPRWRKINEGMLSAHTHVMFNQPTAPAGWTKRSR